MNTELMKAPSGAVAESQVLAVLKPAWAELAREEDSYVRKCAVVGLMLNAVSDQLGHGELGPWLHRNVFPEVVVPEGKRLDDLPHWRRARRWMEAGRNVVQLAQIGHVSDLAAVELANAVLGRDQKPLSESSAAMLDRFVAAVDGKTLAQLTFKFAGLELAKGGDKEWEAFIRAKHPEMIVDGKVPSRGKAGKVSKDVIGEFAKWLEAKAKPRTAKEKQEAARVLLAGLVDVLEGAVKSPLLMVLDPVEFAPVESLTKLWAERLRQLSDSRR
ncbi:MAG: hypothetical protein J0M24_13920 [Verrucomicrobia bacterium]|nr:hypothetical protein [Verrucomicrobiota bacterium]